jgi:hypothetical protein
MNLLIKLIPLLLLIGVCAPSYASVNDVELIACAVYSDSEDGGDEKKEGDTKTEEEEPDCE